MQEASAGFEVFVAVAEAGSISAAARERGTPRETLSRQLALLEERLGVRLLHRGTRALTLTPAGHALLARARPLVAAAREAEAAVRHLDGVPRGRLRISTPPAAGGSFVGELCAAFLIRYPLVELEVFSSSRFVDLVEEGIDVAVRAGVMAAPGLVCRRLWRNELILVAAPDYLAAHGVPQGPAELTQHQCLLGMAEGVRPVSHWPTLDGQQVPVQGRLAANDLGLLLSCALAGLGIALLPLPFVQGHLAAGRLCQVLGGQVGMATALSLVFVERHLMPPRLRAFIEHATAWVAANPPPGDALGGPLDQWPAAGAWAAGPNAPST